VIFALTLFFGAIIASATPAKATPEVILKFRYPEGYDYYPYPGSHARLTVIVDIYAPEEWDDTSEGIVGWSFNVHVDPAVLEPYAVKGASEGYYLYDFCDYYGYTEHYPSLMVGSIDKTTGDMVNIAEYIMGWETLEVGAGGSSGPNGWYGLTYGLAKLQYTPLSETDYSRIEITDARYYTTTSGPEGIPFDSVEVGNYNPVPTPEFPLGAAFQVGLIAAVAYVWWTRRRKLKEVP